MSANNQKYGTVLTEAGKSAIAAAVADQTKVDIKYVGVGDGGGTAYYPDEHQVDLKHEVYQTPVSSVYVDAANPSWIVVEAYLPETAGGWWIRELSLKTDDGTVIGIGNYPESYKPVDTEGTTLGTYVKFILVVTNATVVNLKIDTSLIFVTKNELNTAIENHAKQFDAHGGTYEAIPERMMRRNKDARCQVADPTHPLDAVNMQFLAAYCKDLLDNVGKNEIGTPSILTPTHGSTVNSLEFPVTVTPLTLLAGGQPQPLSSRIRVIRGSNVVYESLDPYNTTLNVIADEDSAGKAVDIIVQHEDLKKGLSPWSDRVTVNISGGVMGRVAVTSPSKNATGVAINDLTVKVAAGAWLDGSSFSGSKTRVVIRSADDDSVAYDSGWVAYATSLIIPSGKLSPGKSYWVAAQHRAASAPASNPGANLTSPEVSRDRKEAGYFTTKGPSAPIITGLAHTIPGTVMKGSFHSAKISGAVSTDGGTVTYSITNITGGLAFSKYSGIGENETITMTAPSITGVSANASLSIKAVSSFGGESASVPVNVVILGKTVWIFDSPGATQFIAEATGLYDIYCGAAGGGSGPAAGGGGGCSILRNYPLTKGTGYAVVAGAGVSAQDGGSSSFGGVISATGGQAGQIGDGVNGDGGKGGIGVGGTENYKGGDAKLRAWSNGGSTSGGGGAGASNGGDGNGPVSMKNGVAQPGTPGGFVPEVGAATGKDGETVTGILGSTTIAYGGKGAIAGGGSGHFGPGFYSAEKGGNGSVVIVFKSA